MKIHCIAQATSVLLRKNDDRNIGVHEVVRPLNGEIFQENGLPRKSCFSCYSNCWYNPALGFMLLRRVIAPQIWGVHPENDHARFLFLRRALPKRLSYFFSSCFACPERGGIWVFNVDPVGLGQSNSIGPAKRSITEVDDESFSVVLISKLSFTIGKAHLHQPHITTIWLQVSAGKRRDSWGRTPVGKQWQDKPCWIPAKWSHCQPKEGIDASASPTEIILTWKHGHCGGYAKGHAASQYWRHGSQLHSNGSNYNRPNHK